MKANPSPIAGQILVRVMRKRELLAKRDSGHFLGSLRLASPEQIESEINRRERNCPGWYWNISF